MTSNTTRSQEHEAARKRWRKKNWNRWSTIYSDASYWRNKAAIAYQVRFTGGKIVDAFEVRAVDALHAELLAIKHGVHRALVEAKKANKTLLGFFVKSDCKYALMIIQERMPCERVEYEAVRNYFRVLKRSRTVQCWHVRAHQGGASSESVLNEMCDNMARRVRREGRASVSDMLCCEIYESRFELYEKQCSETG